MALITVYNYVSSIQSGYDLINTIAEFLNPDTNEILTQIAKNEYTTAKEIFLEAKDSNDYEGHMRRGASKLHSAYTAFKSLAEAKGLLVFSKSPSEKMRLYEEAIRAAALIAAAYKEANDWGLVENWKNKASGLIDTDYKSSYSQWAKKEAEFLASYRPARTMVDTKKYDEYMSQFDEMREKLVSAF